MEQVCQHCPFTWPLRDKGLKSLGKVGQTRGGARSLAKQTAREKLIGVT